MPWTCSTCQIAVPLDDVPCPNCAAPKTAWTMLKDRTRLMVVSTKKKVQLLRGTSYRALAAGDPLHVEDEWVKTEEVTAVPKARARSWLAAGRLPPSSQLLLLRLRPSGGAATVELSLDFDEQPMQELEVDVEAGADGTVDVPFLFVYEAPGDLRVRLRVDPQDPASADERFVLTQVGGAFEQIKTIADDETAHDRRTDLRFEELDPYSNYTLRVDPGAEGAPYAVFEDVPYLELAGVAGWPEASAGEGGRADEGEEIAFPGIHVVDLGEPSERYHAPTIDLDVLGKSFPELPVRSGRELLRELRWSVQRARSGEEVRLELQCPQVPAGETLSFVIQEHDADQRHDFVEQLQAEATEGAASLAWTYRAIGDADDAPTPVDDHLGWPLPEFFFDVGWGPHMATCAQLLLFQDELILTCRTADGELLREADYALQLTLPSGQVLTKRGRTDEQGVLCERGLPPGALQVGLPGHHQVVLSGA